MSSELIEGTFVQREALAERLVDIFEQSARRKTKHSVLLVGPRGIGKSHLVSLVYHRLKVKTDLADRFCIAYLREDEWGITSFLDLLLQTLRTASEEVGAPSPPAVGEISGLTRAQAEDCVWRALQGMLGTKTLFLIIENLNAVFEKIGEQGQRQWRALMQTYPQWAILATTPALFSDISRQVSPFYGFFEVIHLQPLSVDDSIALLKRLAHCNNDADVAAFLDTAVGRARVRAVQHIAGGNHRIFVLFYEFLTQAGSVHFLKPFLKTVDALTPYYQAQMSKLSPQQQKIVNFLCEYRSPATVTNIATNCFTTHQTAASQLKQLLTDRYVRVDRVGREAFYELAEPLLRICVEAKSHRERPLYLLVDFIRYWFSRDELEHKLSDASEQDPGKGYFLAALKQYDSQDSHVHLSPEIASLCAALSQRKGTPEKLRGQAEELAALSHIEEDWAHYIRALIFLKKASQGIPILEERLEKDPQDIKVLRSLASAHGSVGSTDLAEQFLDRAIRLSPNEGLLLWDKGDFLARKNQHQKALAAYEQAVFFEPDLAPLVAVAKAGVLVRMKNLRAARETLSSHLREGDRIRGVFFLYGLTFGNEGRNKEALEYFGKAARAFEDDSNAWGNMGFALCRLGRYDEAIEPLERSLALNPAGHKDYAHLHYEALLETKQYAKAAEVASPEDLSHNIFHQLLKIANLRPQQGKLQQELLELKNAHEAVAWQDAFLGGLIELASFASRNFKVRGDLEDLQIWNSALRELFSGQEKFSILLKLFDVLTRVKVFKDRKALLELPREQRLLLIKEETEEEFSNP